MVLVIGMIVAKNKDFHRSFSLVLHSACESELLVSAIVILIIDTFSTERMSGRDSDVVTSFSESKVCRILQHSLLIYEVILQVEQQIA